MEDRLRRVGSGILAAAFVASLLGLCPCGPETLATPHGCCSGGLAFREAAPDCCPAPTPFELRGAVSVAAALPAVDVAVSLAARPWPCAALVAVSETGPSPPPIVALRI